MTQLVTQLGVSQKTPGAFDLLGVHQQAARQHADRPIQNTHVRVCQEVTDAGIFEKRLREGQKNGIVGTNELEHAGDLPAKRR